MPAITNTNALRAALSNCVHSRFLLYLALLTAIPTLAHDQTTASNAQIGSKSSSAPQAPVITARSNLVLVPALVKTKSGEVVLSLGADDFILTDDGVPQSLLLEPATDSQPLALAIIVQTGGQGASHLGDYGKLGPVLDAVVGGVPHRIVVVSFDSAPRIEQDFNSDTDSATAAIASLHPGDPGAAILDALAFAMNLLLKQPAEYRHAILLFSETIDRDSKTTLDNAVRAMNNTNTAIYSFAFSSTKAAVQHEASKFPGAGPYSTEPYPPGGCMSRDPDADPDAHGKRSVQALDCAGNLLPPLRLARMAFIAAKDGFKRNLPESVARQTGGEYFPFKDASSLTGHLIEISSDVPNYYILSFHPQSPHTGLHALQLTTKDRRGLRMTARKTYWVDAERPGRN